MRATTRQTVLLALTVVAAAACGPPPYAMEAPDAFKRFERSSDFRFITADGVMLKGREVENYPVAELDFWIDALKQHLEERGYAHKSESCFETADGLDGCTVDFVLPYGAEDWVLSETLFVIDDRVILLEAAAPYERFAKVEEALKRSLATFRPDG